MLNVCTLTGNLGADPEIFYSSDGKPVTTFNLAFKTSQTKTGWIRITAFHKLATIVQNHLHKGARVAVVGVLDYQMAMKKNGYADNREILLKFECLIKTKKPTCETYWTTRNEIDEIRLTKKVHQTWDAIQKGVFLANDGSWKHKHCPYIKVCDQWFLT